MSSPVTASPITNGEGKFVDSSALPPPVPAGGGGVGVLQALLGGADDGNCKYIRKQQIGRGATGSAYIVTRVSDGAQFVAKEMELEQMSANARRYAYSEIKCLGKCDHFAIMGFEEDAQEGGKLLLITEFGDAGDLRRHIKERAVKNNYFPEQDVCQVFVQILLSVHHIHTRRMLHRDIKTANVFLSSTGLVKVGDFGFSNQYDETVSGAVAQSLVGTPYYLAPELWNGEKYGKKADMWSVGIILYELLALKRPYEAPTYRDMRALVMNTPLPELPDIYTPELKAVCKKLLCTDPVIRPSASEVLQMPFVEKYLATFDAKVQVTQGLPDKLKAQITKNIGEYRASVSDESKGGGPASPTETPNDGDTYQSLNTAYLQPYEGPVKKLSSQNKEWKDRYLFLDEFGTLVVAVSSVRDTRKGSEAAVRSQDMVNAGPCHPDPNDSSGPKYAFVVELKSQKLWFAAPSESEQQTWIHRIQMVLGQV